MSLVLPALKTSVQLLAPPRGPGSPKVRSQAAVVALLVAIWIFVLLFLFRRQSIKKGTAFILGFVFVLLIIGLSQSPLLKTTIERQRALGEDPSTQARLELMHLELKGLAEGNLLIGYGTYEGNITFQGAAPKEGHNSVSTIAFQYGLLFFVPFLLIFGIIFRKNMTNMRREGKSRQDPFLIGISAAFLVALFSLFLDPVLPMPQTASVIWLIAGLILWTFALSISRSCVTHPSTIAHSCRPRKHVDQTVGNFGHER